MIISNTMKHRQKPGRPTKYLPELGAMIASAMSTGLSLEAAAASCGIGPRTVFDWQRRYPEFLQAIETGRARSLLFWEGRALALATGEAGNASIVALGLKNRSRAASGWHDPQRREPCRSAARTSPASGRPGRWHLSGHRPSGLGF